MPVMPKLVRVDRDWIRSDLVAMVRVYPRVGPRSRPFVAVMDRRGNMMMTLECDGLPEAAQEAARIAASCNGPGDDNREVAPDA